MSASDCCLVDSWSINCSAPAPFINPGSVLAITIGGIVDFVLGRRCLNDICQVSVRLCLIHIEGRRC